MGKQAEKLVEDIEKINEDCDKKYKVITDILNEVSKNNPDKLFVRSKERWEEIEKENYIRKCDEESFFAEPNEPKKDE